MKGYYRRNLPHIEKLHAAYFITFRTLEVFLPPPARTIVLRHCIFENGRKLEMHAAVIMPNHVHLLFTPLEADQGEPIPLADIMKGHDVIFFEQKLLGSHDAIERFILPERPFSPEPLIDSAC